MTNAQGPKLAVELAKNPDRFEQLNQKTGAPLALEIMKIESALQAPQSSAPEKKVSAAPAPVAQKIGTSTKSSLSTEDWIRQRNEDDKKRGLY